MKVLNQYQCEICGTVYNSERIASECESSHKLITNVVADRYRGFHENPDGFPDRVKVTFDNHSTLIYKR